MGNFSVIDAEQLTDILKNLSETDPTGEHFITLADGSSFADFNFINYSFTELTIASESPQGAEFYGNTIVDNSSGIIFDGVVFRTYGLREDSSYEMDLSDPDAVVSLSDMAENRTIALSILAGSSGIVVKNSKFTGHEIDHKFQYAPNGGQFIIIDPAEEEDPIYSGQAIAIRNAQDITIENNEFSEIRQGIRLAAPSEESQNITITGNHFHNLREDGIYFLGVDGMTITNNVMENFNRLNFPDLGQWDHYDFIQYDAGVVDEIPHNLNDVTISNNILLDFEADPQGIFANLRNGQNLEGVSITDFEITGNLIVTGSNWGIVAHGFQSEDAPVLISDNILLSSGGTEYSPRIVLSVAEGDGINPIVPSGVVMSNNLHNGEAWLREYEYLYVQDLIPQNQIFDLTLADMIANQGQVDNDQFMNALKIVTDQSDEAVEGYLIDKADIIASLRAYVDQIAPEHAADYQSVFTNLASTYEVTVSSPSAEPECHKLNYVDAGYDAVSVAGYLGATADEQQVFYASETETTDVMNAAGSDIFVYTSIDFVPTHNFIHRIRNGLDEDDVVDLSGLLDNYFGDASKYIQFEDISWLDTPGVWVKINRYGVGDDFEYAMQIHGIDFTNEDIKQEVASGRFVLDGCEIEAVVPRDYAAEGYTLVENNNNATSQPYDQAFIAPDTVFSVFHNDQASENASTDVFVFNSIDLDANELGLYHRINGGLGEDEIIDMVGLLENYDGNYANFLRIGKIDWDDNGFTIEINRDGVGDDFELAIMVRGLHLTNDDLADEIESGHFLLSYG